MITAHDVQTAMFDKAMRGYATDKVDAYLDEVAAQLEADAKKISELMQANKQLSDQAKEKDDKLAGYVQYEDALKSALLNAQRMGENVIREAQQKADGIVREASIRAEDITHAAQSKTREQEIELERIRSEVAQFKNNVLNLYRTHIESLSTLPDDEANPAESEDAQQEEPALWNVPDSAEKPEEPIEPLMPEQPTEQAQAIVPDTVDTTPVPEEQPATSGFWEQDEHSLIENAPEQEDTFAQQPEQEQPEEQPVPTENSFRGISFSD